MNTMTAFLLIAIIIGVGVFLGNASLTGEEKVIYYDWTTNTELNLETGVTILTNNSLDYNSIKFDSSYNISDNEYRLNFGDDLNFSDIEKLEIEYQFSTNTNNISEIPMFLVESGFVERDLNGSVFSEDYVGGDLIVDNVFGHQWIIKSNDRYTNAVDVEGFGFTDSYTATEINSINIKYSIDVLQNSIITYVTDSEGVQKLFVRYLTETESGDTWADFDFTDLVFGFGGIDSHDCGQYITGDDTLTIDYLKLSYVEGEE